jgi:hypothetical protein
MLRGDLDQYRFQANAADALTMTVSEVGANTSFLPRIRVHGPDGKQLFDTWGDLWGEADITAPLTGTYTVLISRADAADGAGAYLLSLAQAPESIFVPAGRSGGSMVNGGRYTGTILRGDLDEFTFVAHAGDALTLTASEVGTNTSFSPRIRVHGPDGKELGNTWGDLWAETDITAPLSGTYNVLINRIDAADGVGSYMLTLAQAPGGFFVPVGRGGGSMLNGGRYSGTILRGDLDQYSFQAAAGDALTVTVSEVGTNTSFMPRIRVHGPDGKELGNTWGDLWAESDFTAPLAGTYTVLINRIDAADGMGSYLVTMAKAPGYYITPVGRSGGALVVGPNPTGTILRGDLDQWSLLAHAGDKVMVSVAEVGQNTVFMPRIRVHGPDGTQWVNTWGDISVTGTFTAPLTGLYTVLINRIDAGDGTGTYQVNSSHAGIPGGGCTDKYVAVSATPNGHGGLTVTMSTTNPFVPILQLVFASPSNGLVDVGSLVSIGSPFTYNVPGAPSSVVFTVRRLMPGAPTTVPLNVVTGCGAWQTFVGGGTSAF